MRNSTKPNCVICTSICSSYPGGSMLDSANCTVVDPEPV